MAAPIAKTKIQEALEELTPELSPLVAFADERIRWWLNRLRPLRKTASSEELGSLFEAEGHLFSRLRDIPKALDSFRNARKYLPERVDLYIDEATALLNLRRFHEGLTLLNKVTSEAGTNREVNFVVLVLMAVAHGDLKEREKAEGLFERAVEKSDARNPSNLLRLARAAGSLSMPEDAIEFAAQFLALVRRVDRGHQPAAVFFRESPDELKGPLLFHQPTAEAIQATLDRWDGPPNAEHQVSAQVELNAEEWETLAELAGLHPAAE